jgi:hypothetical protein
LRLAAITALVIAILPGYSATRRSREAKIYYEPALDHRAEVVLEAPRRWRTADFEFDALAARSGRQLNPILNPTIKSKIKNLLRQPMCWAPQWR